MRFVNSDHTIGLILNIDKYYTIEEEEKKENFELELINLDIKIYNFPWFMYKINREFKDFYKIINSDWICHWEFKYDSKKDKIIIQRRMSGCEKKCNELISKEYQKRHQYLKENKFF